jgi:hypothetical protein
MRTAVVLFLIVVVATPALAFDTKGYVHHQATGPREVYQCDDGWLDNGYYQNQGYVYGNAYDFGTGGYLAYVSFWHSGWFTWSGPSQYNLRIYDDLTCTEIATLGPFTADDAYSGDVEEIEYLNSWGVNITGQVGVLLEPLSCVAPNDCYPCVYFDQTGDFDGCDRVFSISTPDCTPYFNGDFVFRVEVGGIAGPEGACCYPDGSCGYTSSGGCEGEYQGNGTSCDPNPCSPTPTRSTSWGQLRAGYR